MEYMQASETTGVKSMRRTIDENFYAGLVEEVREAIENKREIKYSKNDSSLYVLINEIIE
jgi:hypothetical protein